MSEPIRAVIWDLDETFWRGTLSEGGIEEYSRRNHDIVVELARRGILSSICSKNDAGTVRDILRERQLWDYFVFPSVDWSPKGARIAAMVDTLQLRPETVLFIDDNPNNRAEAEAAVPGIRASDPSILETILQNPLCRGKDDRAFVRLEQYKLLERRKADELAAAFGDNSAFLRGCDIRVQIETDIESHLDRAVELINRTNQLNFTKLRLSDDPASARQQLAEHVGQYFVQAGLVRVTDKYGDYGYCGFFSKHNDNNDIPGRVVHFCFSCRILGMGVEHWLYEKLGRPPLYVDGRFVTGLGRHRAVDWIIQDFCAAPVVERSLATDPIPEIRFRGGCELTALAHYFRLSGHVTCLETNYKKSELVFMRRDFSGLLADMQLWDAAAREDCAVVGFGEDDARSGFLADTAAGSLLIFSGWGDIDVPQYRHRKRGFRIPSPIEFLSAVDLTSLSSTELDARIEPRGFDARTRARLFEMVAALCRNFTFDGLLGEEAIRENMHAIFARVAPDSLMVVVLPHEYALTAGRLVKRPRASAYNRAVRSAAAAFDNVLTVDIGDQLRSPADKLEGSYHYHRVVYERLFHAIMALARPRSLTATAER